MCLRAGDVRQPAVLLGTPGLDGHLQERRLRSVVDTAPVLLVELPPSLRPAHPRRRHQGTDRPPTRRITKVHTETDRPPLRGHAPVLRPRPTRAAITKVETQRHRGVVVRERGGTIPLPLCPC